MTKLKASRPAAAIMCSVVICVMGCSAMTPKAPSPVRSSGGTDAWNRPKSSDAKGLDPASWEQRYFGLKDDATKVSDQLSDVNSQLAQISAVKDALCQRQAALLSSCIVHAPLSASTWQAGTACKSQPSPTPSRNFTAELRGISGKFQIILDNTIESNLFESEKVTTLQWKARGARTLRDLKLSDIGSIKLKAIEGNFTNLQSSSFALKIDDDVLLTERDFLLTTRTNTSVTLSQIPLTNELSSASCRVDDGEIEDTVQTALKKSEIPPRVETPLETQEKSSELKAKNLEKWIVDSKSEYSTKSDTYLALAQDVSRLRRNLRGELQLGCWAKEIIKTIEINTNGSALPLSDWDRSQAKQQLGTTGQPSQTIIDFGGGLKFTNTDEKSTALFREGGRWLLSANTDLTIGDINNIQIRKNGYSYDSVENCWSTWAGLGKACEWQNRESNRYQLNSLSVKINGVAIYQRDSINAVFERSSLNWVEPDLTKNHVYVDLMRRRDCPVSTTAN